MRWIDVTIRVPIMEAGVTDADLPITPEFRCDAVTDDERWQVGCALELAAASLSLHGTQLLTARRARRAADSLPPPPPPKLCRLCGGPTDFVDEAGLGHICHTCNGGHP